MCARFPEIERSLSLNRAVVEPGSCGRCGLIERSFPAHRAETVQARISSCRGGK